jgi:hypothetical protein
MNNPATPTPTPTPTLSDNLLRALRLLPDHRALRLYCTLLLLRDDEGFLCRYPGYLDQISVVAGMPTSEVAAGLTILVEEGLVCEEETITRLSDTIQVPALRVRNVIDSFPD